MAVLTGDYPSSYFNILKEEKKRGEKEIWELLICHDCLEIAHY